MLQHNFLTFITDYPAQIINLPTVDEYSNDGAVSSYMHVYVKSDGCQNETSVDSLLSLCKKFKDL